jgi:hypothetical protein
MVPVKALTVLLLAIFLGESHPALATDIGGTCGYPSPKDPNSQKEFLDIGNQFLVRNVRIAPHSQGSLVEGEIYNGLRGFFTFTLFKVQLFNADCTYLGANNFSINNFQFGVTRPFRVIVPNVHRTDVANYQIEFLP